MAKKATRESYGAALVKYGENPNIVVLDADLSKSTKTEMFKKAYPERFINMGIAESNMMCVAAGLAASGKIAFASTFAMFAAGRAFEQVRNSIGYTKLNVKIGATHAGISVGEDGASHQCLEDIALMRSIPNMVVINPADDIEAMQAVKAAIDHDGPVYMRFGRLAVEDVNSEDYKFELGKGVQLKDGKDATIIATGLMVGMALEAAKMLEEEGISARVINIHTIKPIDEEIITKAAKETGAIVTAEEHYIMGGLGSAVTEVVCANAPVPVKIIGTDRFGKSGKPAELFKEYGLTPESRNGNVATVLYRSEPIGQNDTVTVKVTQFTDTIDYQMLFDQYEQEKSKRSSAELVEGIGQESYIAFPTIHVYDRGCIIEITAGSGSDDNQKTLLKNLAITAAGRLESIIPDNTGQNKE